MNGSLSRELRRRWTIVVAVVVIAIVGFAVLRLQGIFGSHDQLSAPSVESLDNTTYNPKRVVFEVFGTPGSTATINYLDQHAQPQRVDNTPLPWSRELITNDPTMFADLRAQGDGSREIGCRITVDGIVKDERSIENVNGYISCLDKSA